MMKKIGRVLLSPFLISLSLIYLLSVSIRNKIFDLKERGLFFKKINKLDLPVISVGNISVGGSGKTAVVLEILKHNTSLCILTRGYKSQATQLKQNPVVVKTSLNPAYYGDEPSLIKEKVDEAYIILDPQRFRGGQYALSMFPKITGFLMDDGFQHRHLHRDLDIVLFDMEAYFQRWGLLPWGRFREPLGSLRRADYVLITKWGNYETQKVEHLQRMLKKYCQTVECLKTQIVNIETLHKQKISDGDTVFLFSGLGQPLVFEKDILRAYPSLKIKEHKKFPDHYVYTQKDIEELFIMAKAQNAKLICSEKDFIKIKALNIALDSLYVTSQQVELSENLLSTLQKTLNSK